MKMLQPETLFELSLMITAGTKIIEQDWWAGEENGVFQRANSTAGINGKTKIHTVLYFCWFGRPITNVKVIKILLS